MTTFIDDNCCGPQSLSSRRGSSASSSSHLLRRRSLRSGVPSSSHADRAKDDILAHLSSFVRKRGHVQIDTDSSADGSDRARDDVVARPSNRERGRPHRDYVQIEASRTDDGIQPADRLDPRDAEAAEAIEGGRATATAEADPLRRRMERAQRRRRKRRLRPVGHNGSDETELWGNDGRAAEDDCFEDDNGSGSDGGGERSQGTASERGEDLALTVSHPPLKGPSDAGALDGSLRTAASASSGAFSCSGTSGKAIVGVGGGGGSRYSRRPLRPRQNLWLVLAVSQAVAIGSLHQASIGHGRYSAPRSGAEVAALTLSATSFAVSLAMGMGYLHGPFRDYIASNARFRCAVTAEQLLALLLLLLTSIQAGLVLNPDGGENYLAVEGTEIWNANLFCAAWAGLYGSAHLAADAFFCGDGRVKRWCIAAFSSLCASAALLEAYAGPNCRGGVLAGSAYCDAALNVGMLDIGAAVLALLAAAVTLLLRRRRIRGRGPWRVEDAGFNSYLAGFVAASAMFIVHSVNVGLASSPGGPGSDAGSVFVASWSAWIYSAVLWKAAAESFLVGRSPPEEMKPLEKEHKRMHRRRRAARLNGRLNGSHRSGGERTYATDEDPTDDESEFEASLRALGASLRAMEEGDGDSYELGRSADEDSTASHSKAPLCLETIPRSRSDGRRRRPPDPDGSEGNVGYAHDRSQASSEGRSRNRSRVNPDGYYSPRESGGSSRRGNPEGYDPRDCARNATDYYEPTYGLDDSSRSTAYYSGSQAVNVRVERQEEVSTLGGTLGGWTSRSSGSQTANVRAEQQEDASTLDGTLGGQTSNLARSRGSVTSGPPATVDPKVPNQAHEMRMREYAQEGPSTGMRPILRAPLSHDDDAGPVQINLRQDRSASPAANRAASQQSMDVDKEWDFDHRAPPAPHNQRRVGHSMDRIKALAAQARAVPTGAVPMARGPSPKPGLARRASRDSMMSNFSPIEEGSEETSPSTRASTTKSVSVSQLSSSKSGSDPSSRSKSGSGSRSTRSHSRGKSRSKGRSKNTKSGSTRSTGKSDRRRIPKRGREKPPPPPRSNNGEKEKPPPPPRPSKKDQNNQGTAREDSDASSSNPTTVDGPTSKNKPSNSSSSDPSKTVNESLDDYIASKNPVSGARERKGPTARSSGSVSTSSSDFDVVISGNHSVMTELTQDEFDIPASGDVFHIASSALNAIAEAKYVTTTARAEREEKAARRKGSNYINQTASTLHPRSSDLPPSIPARLPLYNGSDSSSTSRTTQGPGDGDGTPPGYGERKEHPSVEDILASAVKGARIPRNYDAEEVAFSTEDEGEDGSPPGYGERKERRSVEDILASVLKSARRRNYDAEDVVSSTEDDRRQRELQRNSGGVNSPGGSHEEGRGGGGQRRKKSSESKRSGRSSRGKAPSGGQQDFGSDPETTRRSSLRERAIPVPTKGATPPRRRSRSEESSTAFLDSALKISELAIAGGRGAGGRQARRESSMRSFYSEEESHSEYGDYVC